jgi:hypothetical protein
VRQHAQELQVTLTTSQDELDALKIVVAALVTANCDNAPWQQTLH